MEPAWLERAAQARGGGRWPRPVVGEDSPLDAEGEGSHSSGATRVRLRTQGPSGCRGEPGQRSGDGGNVPSPGGSYRTSPGKTVRGLDQTASLGGGGQWQDPGWLSERTLR